MTSELWKGLLVGVVAMGLVACKQESSSSGTAQTEQPAETPDDHGHSHDDDGGHEHAEPETPSMSQETAEGAVALFVDALQNGDFEGALAVCDPTAIGYGPLDNLVKGFEMNKDATPENAQAIEMVKTLFVKPWKAVEVKAVSIRDERAKYTMSFENGESVDVDVVKNDGLWQMFLPEKVLDAGVSGFGDAGVPSGQSAN